MTFRTVLDRPTEQSTTQEKPRMKFTGQRAEFVAGVERPGRVFLRDAVALTEDVLLAHVDQQATLTVHETPV